MEAVLRSHTFATDPVLEPVPYSLSDAVSYALKSKGSRVRLLLAQSVGHACGLGMKDAAMLAEGVEFFHHASLILDDLPCMDDAEDRRGRVCLHLVAGEDRAILAALALINRAYTSCWQVASNYPVYSKRMARIVERCMGELGILDGQARDLGFRNTYGAAEVKAIAARKTGALLQMTLLLPAVLTGAHTGTLLRLSRVARYWGIVYQGLDDFSDLRLSSEDSGKTPFRDLRKARPNLVIALGPKAAFEEIVHYQNRAARQIAALVADASQWQMLQDFHARMGDKIAAIESALEAL